MPDRTEVKVPDIGDFKDVSVIEVLVKSGETIAMDTGLIMVESDKASMEIPSSHAGVVSELRVKVGDKVSEGSVILLLAKPTAFRRAGLPPRPRPRHLPRRNLPLPRPQRLPKRRKPISSATCLCWAPGLVGIPQRSVRRTWA